MATTTGILRVVIEDGGSPHPPPGGRSQPTAPDTSFTSPSPPRTPTVEPVAKPVPSAATVDEQIAAILRDKGLRKTLGNPTATDLAKNPPEFIGELYKQVATASPAANPSGGTPSRSDVSDQSIIDQLRTANATLRDIAGKIGKASPAAVPGPPSAPAAAPNPAAPAADIMSAMAKAYSDGAGLQPSSPWDAVRANGKKWYEAGAPDQPKPPRAEPVNPAEKATEGFGLSVPGKRVRPVATPVEPISDAEKSRQQWTGSGILGDIKGYLPNAIGSKLETMASAYSAASKQAAASGAGKLGQMAAGAGEAVVAAGPVAALAAAELASRAAAAEINKFTKRVETASTVMQQLAGNDHMGMLSTAVDHAAGELEEIPILGKVWAAELKATVAPIRAMHDVTSAFVVRAKELAAFNGPTAQATAMADVRSLLDDIKEADRLGPELARLVDAQSAADHELRELLLPVKEFVVNKLARAIELGLAGWDFVKPLFEAIGSRVGEILDLLQEMARASPVFGKHFEKWLEEQDRKKKLDDQIDQIRGRGEIFDWINAANNLGRVGPAHARNGADEARRGINGPVFPGFEF